MVFCCGIDWIDRKAHAHGLSFFSRRARASEQAAQRAAWRRRLPPGPVDGAWSLPLRLGPRRGHQDFECCVIPRGGLASSFYAYCE
eukprot:scaffold32263_cov129-Isochrysis_galbana.AAC.4